MSTERPDFRLVIIDDNRSDIVLLREAIADSGHPIEVIHFTAAAAALASLAQVQRVDLILCDINMPAMSGLEVVERLRTVPHLAATTVVLMSGSIDRELPAAIRRRCGGITYLRKGITWGDYRGIVEGLYRRMEAPAAAAADGGRRRGGAG